MNLGHIWVTLNKQDKELIAEAIQEYGEARPKSYLNKHKDIKANDPRLAFLKISPVYHSLLLYKTHHSVHYNNVRKDRIVRIIDLIDMVQR